ncbi:unknown [Firmicutes bacterium CAG:103]|nr:unknown [Firmicutes bacterium CAG:103]
MTLNVTTKPLTVSTARTALRTASGSACESDTAAICDRSSGRKPPLRGAKSMPTITADSTCTP